MWLQARRRRAYNLRNTLVETSVCERASSRMRCWANNARRQSARIPEQKVSVCLHALNQRRRQLASIHVSHPRGAARWRSSQTGHDDGGISPRSATKINISKSEPLNGEIHFPLMKTAVLMPREKWPNPCAWFERETIACEHLPCRWIIGGDFLFSVLQPFNWIEQEGIELN